ncbi:MAG TPA: hypothetical protein VF702_01260 [Allosphingosinicella sp.]
MLRDEDSAKRDPQLAMWLLKRADQEKAGTLKRGAAAVRQVATSEEVRESLTVALRQYGRRLGAKREAEGWTKSEDGHWIPPGYGPTG